MARKFLLLACAALALLGGWWMLRRSPPPAEGDLSVSAPVASTDGGPDAHAPQPAALRAPDTAPEREIVAEAAAQAPPDTARLFVVCRSRAERQLLADVQVQVLGTVGEPADAASGTAFRGGLGEMLTTDLTGRVECEVPAGIALRVTAGAPERQVQTAMVEVPALQPGELRRLTLALEDGELTHLCGLVVARETGAPVAGAQVAVERAPRTQSDAAGRFELDFAARRPPWVRVEAEGFAPAITVADRGHESPRNARRIELQRAAVLEILLRYGGDRSALRVELHGKGYELLLDGVFTSSWQGDLPDLQYAAAADASGVCRFDVLPPGVRFDAQVIGPGGVLHRSAEPILLRPGVRERLEWDLRGSEIVGHVVEADGRPAPDITLWLLREEADSLRYVEEWRRQEDRVGSATSAADGSFRLPDVSPGTWLLAPAPGGEIAPAPQQVRVEPGATRVVVDVRLARGLFVRGRLVAPDGTTGVQGWVRADGTIHGNADANAEGVFVLGPLAPGRVRLVGMPHNSYLESEPVELDPPAEGVVLRSRPGSEVSGQVVDEAGRGVQSAITVACPDGSTTMTRTQADGTFRLDGFAAGACALFASTSDGRVGLLTGVVLAPEAPAANQRVVLGPGSTLRLSYEGEDTCHLAFHLGDVRLAGDGLEHGKHMTQSVPPGRVVVEYRRAGNDRKERVELELAPGETREVVLRDPAPK